MELSWGRYKQFNLSTAKAAFLDKIDKQESGCWEWRGAKANCRRYGSVAIAGKPWLAHRASFFLFNKVDPKDLCVCHTCDNGFCVNPEHLFLGTQKDNVHDMENKKRAKHPSCEKHGRAKLSLEDVESIRSLYPTIKSSRKLAAQFNVSKPTILRIVNGEGWITK